MADDHQPDVLLEDMLDRRVNRRAFLKRAVALGVSAPFIAGLLAACGGDDDDDDGGDATSEATTESSTGDTTPESAATEEPAGEEDKTPVAETEGEGKRGGRLKVANTGQPAGLDMHLTGQRTITLIGWHMFEALFTFDGDYETVPMLAEGVEVSEDGLTVTIPLRQGVLFHNGDEMVAADVIASFERWGPVSSLGLAIEPSLESISEVDPYTVEFKLTDPLSALPGMLARQSQGLSIHPKSVLDAAGSEPLPDEGYIGTGPYKFVERQADRFTLLERFDDYVGVDAAPSGYAGSKAAYFDEIEFIPVPDEAARVAGLQSGDYHYLEEIIPDQIEVLGDDPSVNIQILPPRSYGVVIMNTAAGIMTDVKIRQAVQACVAVVPSGQATHGEGYFEPGPGIMMPQTAWHSETSAELYNQDNPEKAAQLLEEAGYDGTPIRILATQEDLGDYNAAVVLQQQMEEAGFTCELQVTDEATLDANLEDDDAWDITTNAYVFRPDPILIAAFASCSADGQWCSDEKLAIVERLKTGATFEDRFAAFEELQTLWYEEAPAVKLVNNFGVAALSATVKNAIESTHFEIEPEFTNSWFEE
jgi:peptide/nickel transport system substrate-binding protein